MKFIVLCSVATFGFISPVTGRDPDWFSRRSSDLENAIKIQNNDERISALGGFMSLASHGEMDEQQKIIFSRAQAQLVAIPGHAEYYRDKILRSQERLKRNEGESPAFQYLEEQMYGFQTLAHLHSPEGVRVLGEMLSDDWESPGNKDAGPAERIPVLSEQATGILSKFPIKDKPFTDRLTMKTLGDAREAWRLWIKQIKSGKRTFRFESDPTEYDLNGPASKEVIQRVERDRKRDEERATGNRKSSVAPASKTDTPQISKPSSIAWLVGGIGLIGAAVWYFVSGRTTAQGRI